MQENTTYISESDASQPQTPIEINAAREAGVATAIDQVVTADAPVKVLDVSSTTEGDIVSGLLEAEGIVAYSEQLPGGSMSDGVLLGETYHGAVFVAAEEEARAREIIAAYASAPVTDEDVALGVTVEDEENS